MTGPDNLADSDTATAVEVERLDRAAQALAAADSKNWDSADVRNRYRGLALAAVGAYLRTPATTAEVAS